MENSGTWKFLDALNELPDETAAAFHQLHCSPPRLECVRTESESEIRAWCENKFEQPIHNQELEREVEEAMRSFAIFETNVAEITKDGKADGKRGSALFLRFSRINHSCVPNCTYYVVKGRVPRIAVRAIRDIKGGEQLSISYVESGLSRGERQERLLSSWGFECDCGACKPRPKVRASLGGEI